jgi:multiple antibiotic resistance protein
MHGYYVHFFISILAITNPIGTLAIFIALTCDRSVEEQRKTALVTAFAVLMSLLISLWAGLEILKAFSISIPAFEVAGGLVILLIGLSMLNSKTSEVSHTDQEHKTAIVKTSVAVIPMAIPIVAGPGAMTTVIIAAKDMTSFSERLILSAECVVLAGIVALVFYFSGLIGKLLGSSGIKIASRLTGLILMAIAVSVLSGGLKGLFPVLAG